MGFFRRYFDPEFSEEPPVPPDHPGPGASDGPPAERRRHGRLRCEDIACSLGTVVDLSPAGIGLRVPGPAIARIGDQLSFTVQYEAERLAVSGIVRRVEQRVEGAVDYGVEFTGTDPYTQEKLDELSRMTSQRFIIA